MSNNASTHLRKFYVYGSDGAYSFGLHAEDPPTFLLTEDLDTRGWSIAEVEECGKDSIVVDVWVRLGPIERDTFTKTRQHT